MRDHLLERRVAERVELHLDHGPHAVHRHADRRADDPRLRERRVPDAVLAELRLQAVGHAEDAAERADVLAVDDDAVVGGHGVAQRGVQGAGHGELRRGGCRGRSLLGRRRGHRAAPAWFAAPACVAASASSASRRARCSRSAARGRRVDVVEELERVEVGLDRHDVARVGGDRLRGIRDLGAHVLGEGALGDEVLLEALDRVAALPVLDVARMAVAGGVVGVRVRLDAVGEALDQRRAAARPRPLDRGARDRVDRGDVVAVDVEAGHAVPDRLVGQGRGTRLARERDADRELVVLHEEDGRRLPDGREVEGLVRVALARGPVAEVGHGHDRVLAQARRVGEAHGMQGLRRERRRLRGGAVGVLVVPVVPVAAERLQDVAGLDAAGEQRDAVAIGREEPVARPRSPRWRRSRTPPGRTRRGRSRAGPAW